MVLHFLSPGLNVFNIVPFGLPYRQGHKLALHRCRRLGRLEVNHGRDQIGTNQAPTAILRCTLHSLPIGPKEVFLLVCGQCLERRRQTAHMPVEDLVEVCAIFALKATLTSLHPICRSGKLATLHTSVLLLPVASLGLAKLLGWVRGRHDERVRRVTGQERQASPKRFVSNMRNMGTFTFTAKKETKWSVARLMRSRGYFAREILSGKDHIAERTRGESTEIAQR